MKNYNIGVEAALEVISGKWKALILCYVGVGINRNGQLLRKIPDISQKVLTEQLKQLVDDDILERVVIEEKPLHIEYLFTNYGEKLKTIMLELCNWGENHIEHNIKKGKDLAILTDKLFENH